MNTSKPAGARRPGTERASIHVGIDARLRAYRGGGIAEHISRLLAGLLALGPEAGVAVSVFEHRKVRARRKTATLPVPPAYEPPFRHRHLWTPPHHRWEGLVLPVELALRSRLDLLHSPDVVIPRAWRSPAVATVHDVTFLRHPELLTGESRRYYGRIHDSVRRAARVITVSAYTRRELLALSEVDPAKVVVVPNAVAPRYLVRDPGHAAADRAALERLGITRPFLLFVSTIEPRKNLPTLLEAFRALIDRGGATWRGKPVDLVLAGGDGWKSEAIYERAKALRLGDRARWLGWVEETDLAPLYRGARALAHPALDEGFGLSPLEAMACGTPVAVSDAGSLVEVIGEAGLRVAPTDTAAWTDALDRILADEALRAQLSEAGPARAAGFTIERQARETLAVYRAAVAR